MAAAAARDGLVEARAVAATGWAKVFTEVGTEACPAVDPEACTEAVTPNNHKQPRRSERIWVL
jgi:hypothetical protein